VDSACDDDLDNSITLQEPAGAYSVEIDVASLDPGAVLPGGTTKDDSCDLSLGAAQSCKVPFDVVPSLPINLKTPELANLFLTAQGPKLDPDTCEESTDVLEITHSISNHPSSPDPKDPSALQDVGGFEFEIWFDEQWICVDAAAGQFATDNGMSCLTSTADGFVRFGCFTIGKPTIDETSTELAVLSVRPQPELYSQIVANQDNGIAVQLLNKGCNLTDLQGHDIAKQECPDSAVTIRWLEGDVNGDCSVDAADGQILAFRWGAEVGALAYNERFDLEPSGTLKFDGDIDIKDVQFVFGRTGSSCSAPHPDQPPVNPKEANP
jgi:hypothetical protein